MPPDPHLLPTVLALTAGAAALTGEGRRLPAQNVVALAVITPLLAWGMEVTARGFAPIPAASAIRHVALTTAALMTARSIARLPGPGPNHLYLRTVAFGLAFVAAAHWPQMLTRDSLSTGVVRSLLVPVALLLLTPWWINKRLQPREMPPAYALTGPVLLLALTIHSAAFSQLPTALLQATIASLALAWFAIARRH